MRDLLDRAMGVLGSRKGGVQGELTEAWERVCATDGAGWPGGKGKKAEKAAFVMQKKMRGKEKEQAEMEKERLKQGITVLLHTPEGRTLDMRRPELNESSDEEEEAESEKQEQHVEAGQAPKVGWWYAIGAGQRDCKVDKVVLGGKRKREGDGW